MHFSGSSKSDCLALVEAFKVSLSHPVEAEVVTQATSVFSHPAYESGECSLLNMVLVRASDGQYKVTSAGRTSGPDNIPELIKK